MISSYHKKQVAENRHILTKIIETVVLCGKQNISIRSHDDANSNFLAILQAVAQGDTILTNHLLNPGDARAKYTSPDV